jgi:hypothetical protein
MSWLVRLANLEANVLDWLTELGFAHNLVVLGAYLPMTVQARHAIVPPVAKCAVHSWLPIGRGIAFRDKIGPRFFFASVL